jgi:hypothetical protein
MILHDRGHDDARAWNWRLIVSLVGVAAFWMAAAAIVGAQMHARHPWERCLDHHCAPIPLKEKRIERDGGCNPIDRPAPLLRGP